MLRCILVGDLHKRTSHSNGGYLMVEYEEELLDFYIEEFDDDEDVDDAIEM